MNIDNKTPLTHTCRYGTTFTADRADLRNGVEYSTFALPSRETLAHDFFEFGMWHANQILPELNGFQGTGSVRFTEAS